MAYPVDDAIAQVLTRLAEADASQVAELPADGGPAATPTLTTEEQILTFLNEGQDELTRLGVLMTFGGGSNSDVASGTKKLLFSALTMGTANQRMHHVREAKWLPVTSGAIASPLQVCSRQWYEVHHPAILTETTATPERIYEENDGVLLGPIPNADGTLTVYGTVFPRPGVAGGDFDDLPQELAPRLIAYACAMVAKQNGAEGALAAVLPIWEAEWRGVPAPRRRERGS